MPVLFLLSARDFFDKGTINYFKYVLRDTNVKNDVKLMIVGSVKWQYLQNVMLYMDWLVPRLI